MAKITIDYDKCKGAECAKCVDVCPQKGLVLDNKVKVAEVKDCQDCKACIPVCPEACIKI